MADTEGHVDHHLSAPSNLTPERLAGVSLATVELAELTRLRPDLLGGPSTAGDEVPTEPDPDEVPEHEREAALGIVDWARTCR